MRADLNGGVKFTLDEKEKIMLLRALREFASSPFGLRDLEPFVESEGIPGAELYGIVYRFWNRRILAAIRTGWEEWRFYIPPEKVPYWLGHLLPEDAFLAPAPIGREITAVESGPGKNPAAGFFSFLVYAVKNRLSLTAKGTLQQKDKNKLAGLPPLALLTSHGGCGEGGAAGERAVLLMLEFALELGLLTLENKQIKPDEIRLLRWLSLPEDNMRNRLYRLWTKRNLPPELPLRLAAAAMENVPRGVWTDGKIILEIITNCGILGRGIRAIYPDFVARWLVPLAEFGFLQSAGLPKRQTVYRWPEGEDLPSGEDTPIWFVQPDFDVVAMGRMTWGVRWDLALLAVPLNTEPLEIFRLSKESFRRAWLGGRSAQTCLRFLESHAMAAVPDLVRTAFADWEREFQKEMSRAECPPNRTGREREAGKYPAFSVIFREKSTDFAVSVLRERRERLILEKGSGNLEISPPFAAGSRLSEQALPAPDSIWTACAAVPPAWLKRPGNYHASTKKELALKAIEWKTVLKLKTGGEERFVIPKRLSEDGVSWCLHGIETGMPVELGPADWQEMQIVHPASLTDLTGPRQKGK